MTRGRSIGQKQRESTPLIARLIECLDALGPGRQLADVGLTELKHVASDHLPAKYRRSSAML